MFSNIFEGAGKVEVVCIAALLIQVLVKYLQGTEIHVKQTCIK